MQNLNHQLKCFKKKIIILSIATSFSACGILPITDKTSSSEDLFFEDKVLIETKAATQTDAEVIDVSDQMIEEEFKPRVSFTNSRGYWLAALEYLQVGEEEDAEWALRQALKLQPNSKISKILLHQIESDAINLLGESYFEYTIKRGDSLSKLAKIHLNDPLKFYILAKYNQISNPSRLIIGRSINIPGKKQKPPQVLKMADKNIMPVVSVEIPLEKNADDDYEKSSSSRVSKLFENKEYDALIILLSDQKPGKKAGSEPSKLLVEVLYLKAKELLSQGKMSESKVLLHKAIILEPDNIQVNMALIDMDETGEAQKLILQSRKALAANSPIEAYELINRALKIQPDFIAAIESKKEIKQSLSMYYYKNALMAQRRQELGKAIKFWDEVLTLDENNQNAKLYRAKSIALQTKMKKFVSAL